MHFAAVAVLVTSVVLLLIGIAHGIGAIFEPDKPWVGEPDCRLRRAREHGHWNDPGCTQDDRREPKKTVAKYEQQHAEQRRRFGQDVRDVAASVVA